ncbi:endonuclease-reverse transcriptase [Plakobranchus ocellatus]|uniref:Endonuclease-reverse transcriptase n=1 Tax=Plakobranchus ocellatus TaxID=259542 RepID=A0AAV4BBN2_9GAST|nr:endonuclease-reverse transcriptase [Plakobranchus ocellatus]
MILLKRITTDALEDHEGPVSIGGRTIPNLGFADDSDGRAGKEEELASLVNSLDGTATAYSMEISAEKTKLMTNNSYSINTDIRISGQKLETANQFKDLGVDVADEGSRSEILFKMA